MSNYVYIHRIPRESAYGVDQFRDPNSGKLMNKTKIGDCKDKITALYSSKVGGLKNGLSYKPWIENGVQVKDETTGRSLTLQQKKEQQWGLPDGFLANKAWRKGDSLKSEDMTYFQKKSWALNDGTTVLDTSNFDDDMFYHVALDSKFIANSEKEWKDNKWPFAIAYISIAGESDEMAYAKNKRKVKAYAALENSKFSPSRKRQFVWILELASTATELTEEQVNNVLFKYISADNGYEGGNIDKFNELYALISDEVGRKELEARLFLRKLVENRIVIDKGETYLWNRAKGQITLGDTYTEAIQFLLNPGKEGLLEELESELKAKII